MKDFDSWNILKKELDRKDGAPIFFPQEGEVWMSSIGHNVGFEQDGGGNNFSRPVLVIKKFNNYMFWTVALSSKQKNYSFYYNFTDPYRKNVSAILPQMKLLSIKRFIRKMYDIKSEDFRNIKTRLKSFL